MLSYRSEFITLGGNTNKVFITTSIKNIMSCSSKKAILKTILYYARRNRSNNFTNLSGMMDDIIKWVINDEDNISALAWNKIITCINRFDEITSSYRTANNDLGLILYGNGTKLAADYYHTDSYIDFKEFATATLRICSSSVKTYYDTVKFFLLMSAEAETTLKSDLTNTFIQNEDKVAGLAILFDYLEENGEQLIFNKDKLCYLNLPKCSYVISEDNFYSLAQRIVNQYTDVYYWLSDLYGYSLTSAGSVV